MPRRPISRPRAATVRPSCRWSAQIYSPISGVVLSRAVDEGQTVASGYSTPTLFTIANDLRQMQVIANVDEADIGAVKEGQRVDFTVDTYTDDTFHGTVRQVRLQSTTTSNVVTYEVVIDAPNPDLKLKPGMTATTTIYTMERGGVFVVPAKALRFVPSDITAQQRKELPAQHVYVRGGDGTLTVREVTERAENEALVFFDEVSDLSSAELLAGCELLAREEDIDASVLEEAEALPAWEGWSVHDERAGYVGEVVEVAERATQPLLTVRRPEGGEALIPLVDEFIVGIDEGGRRIDVSLPAGLLDL